MITEIYSNSFNSNKKYLVLEAEMLLAEETFQKIELCLIFYSLNNRKILKIRNKSY